MADPLEDPPARRKVVAGQVQLAATYLRDARILSQHGSRNAANLLFLAAEAALLAVMTSEGIDAGRATQHQLGAMTDKLPDTNPLKPEFHAVEALTAYATTFRYVTPAGRIKDGPNPEQLELWMSKVDRIIGRCAMLFGVALDGESATPPRTS